MGKTPSSSSTTAWWWRGVVLRQGFAKLTRRRRGVGEGEGCALDVVLLPSLHPSIYREKGEGAGPSRTHLGGAAAKGRGERVACPPSQGGAPSRVPPATLGAWALGGGDGAQPT